MKPKGPGKGKGPPVPNETGAVVKPWGGRVSVCLVYPNTYHVGMSSLGFQTVYGLVNSRDDALAERAFIPEMAPGTKSAPGKRRMTSVESGRPPADFDLVAFSISFENDYPNVADALGMCGLPPYASQRSAADPLVIMGGVCAFANPEPLAPFFDAVLVGEGEELVHEFLDAYGGACHVLHKDELLQALAHIPGVYVPSLYEPHYTAKGEFTGRTPMHGAPERVVRRVVDDLDVSPAASRIISKDTDFSDMYMVELTRGCGRQCRFCMAGYVYRPPRSRSVESVACQVREGRDRASKVGLVGAAVSDYPGIEELVREVGSEDVSFTASSMRADALSPELVELLSKGAKTASVAPEAGSQRLRDLINKDLTEGDILDAVRILIRAGILNIKLYFMVGLPTETDEDVEEIVRLGRLAHEAHIEEAKPLGRAGRLTLSVNCFVPKPWTPFQWEAMPPVQELSRRIKHIVKSLKGVPNTNVIHDVPKWAWLQGALARGDRRLAPVILDMAAEGGPAAAAFKRHGLTMEQFAGRERADGEAFPWEVIDTGIKRGYLLKERKRAYEGKRTKPCDTHRCRMCGVCIE